MEDINRNTLTSSRFHGNAERYVSLLLLFEAHQNYYPNLITVNNARHETSQCLFGSLYFRVRFTARELPPSS